MEPPASTKDAAYARRLLELERPLWKRLLDVQRPYRWHLRSLRLGFVLDVGCGIGRNLRNLGEGAGVGIDHNEDAVAVCRSRGLVAFTPSEFRASPYASPGRFDALLFAHVLEHMRAASAAALVAEHLVHLRPGGRVVMIAPQEAGFGTDPSHVEMHDLTALAALADGAGLVVDRAYSFPFPRPFGRVFRHNEFVLVARKRW